MPGVRGGQGFHETLEPSSSARASAAPVDEEKPAGAGRCSRSSSSSIAAAGALCDAPRLHGGRIPYERAVAASALASAVARAAAQGCSCPWRRRMFVNRCELESSGLGTIERRAERASAMARVCTRYTADQGCRTWCRVKSGLARIG